MSPFVAAAVPTAASASARTRRRRVRVGLLVAASLVAAVLTATAVAPTPARAAGVAGSIGANGQHRRAFYNFGHNPNTFNEVSGDLTAGANALEPDVMSFSNDAFGPGGNINATAGASGLFMYHDHVAVTTRMPDTVESWLDFVRSQVVAGTNVALIAFDIKSAAATAANGPKLLTAVHDHLNHDGVAVNVIFSVASEDDSSILSQLIPNLGPSEGVMIDGQNDPAKIYNYLHGLDPSADGHIAFGNGSIGVKYGLAPNVLLSIEEASWMRAGQVPTFAIPYAYPIELKTDMEAFITAGADGLIPDNDSPLVSQAVTQVEIKGLAGLVATRDDVYMATAADDPLHPVVEAYALRVDTLNESGAGTDSNITFTLKGCNGTSSVTVDTEYISHMEAGERNYVTVPSKDLGQLQSLTLSSDGTRGGIFDTSPWHPGLVQVSSAGWGIPYSANRNVDFTGATVTGSTPHTRSIGGWGNRCQSLTTVGSAPNPSTYGQAVTFTSTVAAIAGSVQPTGAVDFFDGATSIGSATLAAGTAAFTTTALHAGNHAITAHYAGDSVFLLSVSSPSLSQAVSPAPTVTSLTAQPTPSSTFGKLVTFTAAVSVPLPGAGLPTGDVVFTVDGATVQTTALSAALQAAVATTSLGAGSHLVTATYQGDSDFLASTTSLTHQVVCDVTITGDHTGGLQVTSGSTCLTNATVHGAIVVRAGASLNLQNTTVSGSVVANHGPGTIRICGSSIGVAVDVRNAQGLVIVGDPGPTGCPVNTIAGALILKDNLHGVRAINNTVGTLQASNNSGPGPYPGDTTVISGNHP